MKYRKGKRMIPTLFNLKYGEEERVIESEGEEEET
jgi:hypothetical protein